MIAPSRRFTPWLWPLLAALLVVALLPWWRNHDHLRDLFDYGIVIEANGRLAQGERPYVDFITPIQAGFLGLNWVVERLGGGDYRALTLGGAALIALSALLLPLVLARRWPVWAAVLVGGAVTVSAASQHTILWHNALGVTCLALATWSAAIAPVVRRATWPWHALAAAGLFLGGINKLNFQLLALVFTAAWALRAGLLREASWGRVAATVVGAVVVGVVLPVAAELAWTGASLKVWLANVVQLAGGSRSDLLREVFSWKFLVEPIHNYYGRVVLPQVGVCGLVLSAAAFLEFTRARSSVARIDRWLRPLAVVLATAAGAALLATNFEIACLGLGAWLVLAAGLWLGFDGGERKVALLAGLVLPATVFGVAAWVTAWQGQRSQFGFSRAARADYQPAENAGAAFGYLRGLHLPPDVVHSFALLERALPAPGADGRRPVFYGPGLEFADRIYPAVRVPGRPLWSHWGTSYGPKETDQLAADFASGEHYQTVVVTIGFENWPDAPRYMLRQNYVSGNAGQAIRVWARRDQHTVDYANVFDALARFGGNLDIRLLRFDQRPFGFRHLAGEGLVLGTDRQEGTVLISEPFYRMRGVAVVERLPGAGESAQSVEFKLITHGAIPEELRWAGRVELPAGQRSSRLVFEADGLGRPVELWSRQTGDRAGIFVGYRELELTNSIEIERNYPVMAPEPRPLVASTPEMLDVLFGNVAWRPQQLALRGARMAAGAPAFELASGGELWLHTDRMSGELGGRLTLASGSAPIMVRLVWYKGGRVQVLQSDWIMADKPFAFRGWTAEPGGWFGLVLEATDREAAAQVRINHCTLSP
jgi:hypothetical protein